MAIFQFGAMSIPYQMEFAPFPFDLLLLQGSRFSVEFWRPLLEDLTAQTAHGGRIITCEWNAGGASLHEQAEILNRLISTLGLVRVHVVAFDDAAKLVGELQKVSAASFAETLMFPQGGPKGDMLVRAVREFCGV